MSNIKPIRYVVMNPGQTDDGYSASYNTALGKDPHNCDLALYYARQNASRFGGEVFAQFADGEPYQELPARKKTH